MIFPALLFNPLFRRYVTYLAEKFLFLSLYIFLSLFFFYAKSVCVVSITRCLNYTHGYTMVFKPCTPCECLNTLLCVRATFRKFQKCMLEISEEFFHIFCSPLLTFRRFGCMVPPLPLGKATRLLSQSGLSPPINPQDAESRSKRILFYWAIGVCVKPDYPPGKVS